MTTVDLRSGDFLEVLKTLPDCSTDALDLAHVLLDAATEFGELPTAIFPTEESGIGFSWIEDDLHFSMEINSDLSLYMHLADVRTGRYRDEEMDERPVDMGKILDKWMGRAGGEGVRGWRV